MPVFALLPGIAFILLWFHTIACPPDNNDRGIREAFILTSLFWSAFMVVGTELLSIFRLLTTVGVIVLWLSAIGILAFIHQRNKTFLIGWEKIKTTIQTYRPGWFDVFGISIIVITMTILLITAVMSPPNIHDVLAYHMSRVMHWIQNRSLAFFPTPNTWQLWMPPFSEFSQLHGYLLAGTDLLASLPQWYSLIFIMVIVSSITESLGAGRRGQCLSAIFIMTVPIIVLQASGAKNDIVLAFTFAALLYFVVKASLSHLTLLDWIACGISVGLGVLTKGSFAFFALPLLAWLLIVMLKKEGWQRTIKFALLGLLILVILNGGHWLRNTGTFGTPLYVADESSLINGRFGLDVTISNLSRHAAVQMNGKYGFINVAVISTLERVHNWLDMPLFDPQITLGPREFYYVPNREEVAGNPFHFSLTGLLVLTAVVGNFTKKADNTFRVVLVLAMVALGGLIIFSAVFRWQAWSTRLLIPYFVLFAPVFGVVFGKWLPPVTSWGIGMILIFVVIAPLFNNYSRAFSWDQSNRNSIWRLTRKGVMFANNHHIEGALLEMGSLMEQSGCRTYGIVVRTNAPEYLLWGVLSPDTHAYYLSHIMVDNASTIHTASDFDPCGIVFFEVPFTEREIDEKYQIAEKWSIGDTYPFSLFLEPQYWVGAP